MNEITNEFHNGLEYSYRE